MYPLTPPRTSVLALIMFLLMGCGVATASLLPVSPTAETSRTTNVASEAVRDCTTDPECMIVAQGYCGGATAIGKEHLDAWNQYLREDTLKRQGRQTCPETMPLDRYEAKCANTQCVAVEIKQRAILSFSEKPLLNKPVTLRLSFRLVAAASQASARIELPDGFELVSGSLEWQGEVGQSQEQAYEAVVKTTRPGYYQVKGQVFLPSDVDASWLADTVYVEVAPGDAIFGSKPENNWDDRFGIPVPRNNRQIRSQLLIQPTPELYKDFMIVYRVTLPSDLPDPCTAQLGIVFPLRAFEVITVEYPSGGEPGEYPGQLSWIGNVGQGQTLELKARLKAINTGWGHAYGQLIVSDPGAAVNPIMDDAVIAQLYVDEYSGSYVVEEVQPVVQATATPILINTPIPYPILTPHPTAELYPGLELTTGGPYAPDEHTLLLLHFDGYYAGTQDEPGTAQDTSFAEGRYGQGVLIDNADRLAYTTAGNLNPEAGTIEFWVRPEWDGDDGQMHIFFETAPADYGIQIGKDGVGNLQFIIWTPAGGYGVVCSLLDWQAGEWHHLAAVWDRTGMAVFIDGQEAGSNPAAIPPQVLGATFLVGASPDLGWQADAVIDELRISDVPRPGNREGYPGQTASAQEAFAQAGRIELTGPLLVDSQAGRLYASGRVGGKPQTLVLAATDGRLLATYDITGFLALDSVHGWLVVDRDDQGLAVLDAQTGILQATIPLPDRKVVNKAYWRPGLAPQADPATGQVLAFRDNLVYVADPAMGVVVRTIPFDIPKAEDCRTLSGPLPIEWATYDSARRFLYLDFETYVCTPWFGHTLVSYDMTSGTEIARRGVPPVFSATAFDGYLYGSSWFRMGDGFRWAWRDGQPWFESSDWSYGAPGFEVDATRQRLYAQYTGGIHVFDAHTMALIMIAPLPVDVQGFAGYDPKTDQLYSLVNGRLRPWSPSAIQPPTPEPFSASQPPTTSVRSLLISPAWPQDKTLFGIWNAEDLLGTCWVFGGFGGPLYVSADGGVTWSWPRGGLPDGCDQISALAVSPGYARDRTLLAGVIGLGLFRSSDGGQLWEPSSAGLLSMGIEQILLSPGFAWDGTAFARVAPAGGRRGVYRSRDGGRSWQGLDMNLELMAMSPEFDQDHTLMGVAVSYVDHEQRSELHVSRDGGDHWERVGDTPAGKGVTLLSLAPLFEKWKVLFAFAGNQTLYRSADAGQSWDAVLTVTYPIFVDPFVVPVQLVYAPDIEVNRPVFLLVRTRQDIADPLSERVMLYRSGDGGLTWQELELPEDVSPTALAISPNYAQDGLLFVGTADGRVLTVEGGTWMATGR